MGEDNKECVEIGVGIGRRFNVDNVFGDVFEEMLVFEVLYVRLWWLWVGGIFGVVLGYIVVNVLGVVVGGEL